MIHSGPLFLFLILWLVPALAVILGDKDMSVVVSKSGTVRSLLFTIVGTTLCTWLFAEDTHTTWRWFAKIHGVSVKEVLAITIFTGLAMAVSFKTGIAFRRRPVCVQSFALLNNVWGHIFIGFVLVVTNPWKDALGREVLLSVPPICIPILLGTISLLAFCGSIGYSKNS